MRLFVAAFILLQAAAASAAEAVYFNLSNLTSLAPTNRTVLIIPSDVTSSSALPVMDRIKTNSGTAGAFWVSNMLAGTYTLEVQGPPATTRLEFFVDSTNAIQYARSNRIVTPTSSPASFYTKSQVDALLTNLISRSTTIFSALQVGSLDVTNTAHFLTLDIGSLIFDHMAEASIYGTNVAPGTLDTNVFTAQAYADLVGGGNGTQSTNLPALEVGNATVTGTLTITGTGTNIIGPSIFTGIVNKYLKAGADGVLVGAEAVSDPNAITNNETRSVIFRGGLTLGNTDYGIGMNGDANFLSAWFGASYIGDNGSTVNGITLSNGVLNASSGAVSGNFRIGAVADGLAIYPSLQLLNWGDFTLTPTNMSGLYWSINDLNGNIQTSGKYYGNGEGITNLPPGFSRSFPSATNALALTDDEYFISPATSGVSVTNVTGPETGKVKWGVLHVLNTNGSALTFTYTAAGRPMGSAATNSVSIPPGYWLTLSVGAPSGTISTNYATVLQR